MFFEQFKYQIRKVCNNTLPGNVSHRKMIPPERKLSIATNEAHLVKESSVLILLFPDGNELYTCLIKRPSTMKHHAGQIAFPGGQIDKTDRDKIATALREANEEIGVDTGKIEILGALTNLYISISQFRIHPIIGWMDNEPTFKLNNEEVEELILFPLLRYTNTNFISETELEASREKIKVPCIFLDDKIIWGATAMILSELLDVIHSLEIIKSVDNF